jgi:hypothetical protein
MMRHLLALASCFLSCSLLACSSGTGDIPGPGCTSVQSTHELSFSPAMAAGAGDALQCLERAPTVSTKGEATCLALHGSKATGAACTCPADQGLQPVSDKHKNAVGKFVDPSTGASVTASCVCEVKQLTSDDGQAFNACKQDPKDPVVDAAMKPVNGYCYVDADNVVDSPEVLSDCPSTERRGIRFVGRPATQAADDISVVVICEALDCETADE